MIYRLIIFFLLLCPVAVRAAMTNTAASASYADVNSQAVICPEGGTVIIPAGSATWPTGIQVSKNITLQGAGTNTTGATVITLNIDNTVDAGWVSDPPSAGFPRVTGIKWINLTTKPCIQMMNSLAERVDHCWFDLTSGGGVAVYASGFHGRSYGVMDHCTVINGIIGVRITGPPNAWSFPAEFGTTNAFYLEDNLFSLTTDVNTYDHRVYHEQGGRGVVRYNNFNTSAGLGEHGWLDAHGNQSYSQWGGNATNFGAAVTTEQYYNTVAFSATTRFAHLRGGAHIIFGNALSALAGNRETWELDEEEYWQTDFFGPAGPPWGPTSSPSTSHLRNTWPAQMAITNTFFGTNTYNGSPVTSVPLGTPAVLLQENRDFWFTMPNATNGSPPGRYSGYVPLVYPHPLVGGAPPITDPGIFSWGQSSYSVPEAGGSVALVVNRSGGSGAVTVTVTTSNGTATAGHDYTATSQVLSWADGATGARNFTVPIINSGDTAQTNRTFTVTMSAATGGATIGNPAAVTVTILMNQPSGTIQWSASTYATSETSGFVNVVATRTGGSAGAISATYATANGSAIAGRDYNATSGTVSWPDGTTSSQNVSITILNSGDTSTTPRTFTITLSGPQLGTPVTATITIAMNPPLPVGSVQWTASSVTTSEGSTSVILSAQRFGGSSGPISVNFATVNGSALAGRDYVAQSGTLNWANLDTANKAVTIFQINSGDTSTTPRVFTVTLSNPTGGAGLGKATVTISITMNPPITVNGGVISLSSASYTTGETNGTVTISIGRVGSTNSAASVSYTTVNGSAVAGTDYTATSGTKTWGTNVNNVQTFTVPIINSGTAGQPRVFSIQLGTPTGGATLGIASALVSIQLNAAVVITPTKFVIGGKNVSVHGPISFQFR